MLLMWMKILRVDAEIAKSGERAVGPPCSYAPCAVRSWRRAPRRIISSSVHSVPSKKTSGAPRRRSASDGVIAAQPGMKNKCASVPSSQPPRRRSARSRCLGGVALLFQIERHLARHREDAEASGRRRELDRLVERSWRRSTQRGRSTWKIGLAREHASTRPGGVERERVALAHGQEAADRVDVAAGQRHAGDRRGAQPLRRPEPASASICARRSGDAFSRNQSPHRPKRPATPGYAGPPDRGPGSPAADGVRVPLREAAARGRSQHDHAQNLPRE